MALLLSPAGGKWERRRSNLIQSAQHFGQEQLVFQVHSVIEIGPEPVFFALAILRHHDDRRLQAGDHAEDEIEQDVGERIEGAGVEQPAIKSDPARAKSRCSRR